MFKHDKSKFTRDLRLARGFFVFLGLVNLWIAADMLLSKQCFASTSALGYACSFFGSYIASLLIACIAIWLIYFAFSKRMATSLAKHYS
jgi:hypothetical protein